MPVDLIVEVGSSSVAATTLSSYPWRLLLLLMVLLSVRSVYTWCFVFGGCLRGCFVFSDFSDGGSSRSVFHLPCGRVDPSRIPGDVLFVCVVASCVTLDWGSCLRRRRRRQRTLLPLLPSVSGWPMLVQRQRCVLEAVPGVGSCGISKVWACSGRGKVDRLLFRRSSPAASGAEACLDLGVFSFNFQLFHGVCYKTPGMCCATLLIYPLLQKKS